MRLALPTEWQLPAPLVNRLGDTAGRQRAMTADGHLLLILHEPPVAGAPERTGRLFWRNPEGEWKSKGLGDGPQALKRHVTEFAERAEELEQRWQSAETAADYYLLLRTLAPLHRAVRNLHATLQQARELLPADRDLINLRDQVGEIERTVELLHGDAKNGLDFTVAHQAERQAERTYDMAVSAHRLNRLAATFFPVATLSTIYGAVFGMLLAHPGDQGWSTPTLFWSLLGLGLLGGFMLARVISRKPPPIAEPAAKSKPKRR
jgi:hypothetical protein